ncbi:MAG: efflux RND transporter periplasmic adaptor subunit [Myxococcales bacterium]|nr:efflux RND transporter periplasmic adaptor subunit [Myxococcales bacterium]
MKRLRAVLIIVVTAAIAIPLGVVLAHRAEQPVGSVSEAPKYHCPMHPTVVSDQPGLCPICNMKLVTLERPVDAVEAAPQFHCPMHPTVVSDQAGLCPICNMRLVKSPDAPVPSKEVVEGETTSKREVDGLAIVELDVTRQQLIGLRTTRVDRGPVGGALRTVARVSVDETRVRRVNVKVPGYVERVFVDFVGKSVRKGQPLFAMYSPEVLAAENEFLIASRAQSPGMVAASRRKLELWDVPEAELQRLEREGTAARAVTFVSPASGVITRKELVEGTRLEAGAMPYEVVDLSTVWVLAEVYETELRFVSPGLTARLTLSAFPGKHFDGTVLFIDPLLDPKTRTTRVRLAFANADGALRPEMFGEVTIARPANDVLRVPADALIRSGADDVVFLSRDEGRFEPRRVTVGEVGREFAEVLEGLSEGDAVVTRANFLIDSESRLRASLARMSPPKLPEEAAVDDATLKERAP